MTFTCRNNKRHMDFEAILSTFPSKDATELIAKEIAREPKYMPKLWEFAFLI